MEAAEVPALPPIEMAEMTEENGSAAMSTEATVDPDPAAYTVPPATEDEEGEPPADFERLWKAAHDNPQDFTSWTDLLQYCEQEVCDHYFEEAKRKESSGFERRSTFSSSDLKMLSGSGSLLKLHVT